MASVASSGASPLSQYDLVRPESGDENESWTYIEYPGGSNTSSIGFFNSPASASLSGFDIVGASGPSPPPLSPFHLDFDAGHHHHHHHHSHHHHPPPAPPHAHAHAHAHAHFPTSAPTSYPAQSTNELMTMQSSAAGNVGGHRASVDGSPFLQEQNILEMSQGMTPQDLLQFHGIDVSQFQIFNTSLAPNTEALTSMESFEQHHTPEVEIPQHLQSGPDVSPWSPTNVQASTAAGPRAAGEKGVFRMEGFITPSPPPPVPPMHQEFQHFTPSISPIPSTPPSPPVKLEFETSSTSSAKAPSPLRKVKSGKIEKRKNESQSSIASSLDSNAGNSKFVIVTPNSITSQAGRANPYECFEALRPSQKGRKGPLANEIKESALQVRRLGACFCCHARKVKCDKERPCKNCKKLMVQVPQVVCWQFQDFLTVLFPDFIRGHFKKDDMSKFIGDNIESFTVADAEKQCQVELFSGMRFSATLSLRAKFFTAKTADVLQHWHMHMGSDKIDLQSRGSAPIAIELDGAARDDIRKKVRDYIQSISQEPTFAEQVTDSFGHTDLPQQILQIVQTYAQQSESSMVKKALSIYAMHYVMTRHLCLTRQTILNLQSTKLVPQNVPWVTPRVLNRQIKGIIDELLMREMQVLFESFSRSLKPKLRKEWAPCLASFLVLCLFMEAVETAADNFVISQNEINMRNRYKPQYKRKFAVDLNQEVENLPFKQFAFQFHQIYQTHIKDASAKSFNPLLDDSVLVDGEMDAPAIQMVLMLRELIQDPHWGELDFLTMDPILPNEEDHPYPRDISLNYTGRLVAKFLLSFTAEKYIFEPTS